MTRELRFETPSVHEAWRDLLFEGSTPEFHEQICARAILDMASVASTTNHGRRAVLLQSGAARWGMLSFSTNSSEPHVRTLHHVESFGPSSNQTVLIDIKRIQDACVADIQRANFADSWLLRERFTQMTHIFDICGAGLANCRAQEEPVRRVVAMVEGDALLVARGAISAKEALMRTSRRLMTLHRRKSEKVA